MPIYKDMNDKEMKFTWAEYLYLEELLSREIEEHKGGYTETGQNFINNLKLKILHFTNP